MSHHIRALEQSLGVLLFERMGRSVALTAVGESYLATVSRAFSLIAEGTRATRVDSPRSRVRVSLLPSFAANWLLPRLDAFRLAYPQIEVILDPTLRRASLESGEADIAIRFGNVTGLGEHCELLVSERLIPVMSPSLAARKPIAELEDINGHTLLFSQRPAEWEIWAQQAGIKLAPKGRWQLTDYNIVLQAAVNGKGIAMGRELLVADHLRRGVLFALLPTPRTSPMLGYWLLQARKAHSDAATTAFVDWLRQEITAS